jgi:hypothetical protein
MLALHEGVPDVPRLLRLYHHFAGALLLELLMPEPFRPGDDVICEQHYEFLSDREIDLILKELEAANNIFNYHVKARVTDAWIKLDRALYAMRGREPWATYGDNTGAEK